MILIVSLLFVVFILLSVGLSFYFALRMGQAARQSSRSFWLFYFRGAAMIFAVICVAWAGWYGLLLLDGGVWESAGSFILSCLVATIYTAIIWLPIYSYCFRDTRNSPQTAKPL